MRIIEAEPGEVPSDLILRTLLNFPKHESTVKIRHNETEIFVYSKSCFEDLCDKFDLQRKCDKMESQYRR